MDENKEQESISMFERSADLFEGNDDSLEEIFALNLGDFLTEHLFSDELTEKISQHETDKVQGLKNQLQELNSIYSTDKTLSILGFNSKEDYILYNSIAKTIKEMAQVDACHIYLVPQYSGMPNPTNHDIMLVGTSLQLEEDLYERDYGYRKTDKSIVVQAFNTGNIVVERDASKSEFYNPEKELEEDKVYYCLAVPMKNTSETVGVTIIESYSSDKEIENEFVKMIEITAQLFAISIAFQRTSVQVQNLIDDSEATVNELQHMRAEMTALIGDLGNAQQMFVEKLALAVDARSNFAKNYSRSVAELAKEICSEIQLNEKTKDLVYYAALLRNIGKITLPMELFNKKGKLSKEDWLKLYNHPNVGVNLLMSINFMAEIVPYIHYHKERWDGLGRAGMKGSSIPLGSRIIAIADAYCALTSERTYRKAKTNEQALEIIKEESGQKWDPMLVEVLCQLKGKK